ncbi:MAG: bifunctional diguanylate cyclase/phosphodiesterase, partial [Phenylobacterium sp.]|uniref:putative bifunctional diguanylate cyclase/phosphodiesterase n=1 Tax=Phenylobacterium sp. TaxID=1871053 RepID=UPI00271EDA36
MSETTTIVDPPPPEAVEVLAGLADPALLLAPDGRVAYANTAAEQVLRTWPGAEGSGEYKVLEGRLDALTGLVDRVGLAASLEAAIGSASAAEAVAVLCLDLDRFKAVNDTLGHPTGDSLLRKVAQRLRSAVREGDTVARMGGDEFVVVQRGALQPEAAEALCRRLTDLVGRTYLVDGHTVDIGVSIGVAIAPDDGADADLLLRKADMALYRAKAEGRGMFRFFEPGMDAALQQRRKLEVELRQAIALRRFELAYQPQFTVETRTVTGFEALLRWNHPERGQLTAAEFVPLAEEVGLIAPIGEWVLRTACRQAATWPDPIGVAVNISPVQFRRGGLVDTVRSALADSGLDPRRLEVEITEAALLHDTAQVVGALHAMRDMGVRIAMDDFGTGYSSLSYLQKFPFDRLKIDKSFIQRMAEDPDSAAIVRAVTALGRGLGVPTTAEGVETEDQLSRVRSEGCEEVQGFYTGRPLSGADAARLLSAGSPGGQP